jgi:ElaB/YqjD/DUF883 family membrane-anchored ribosome-binding protein
MEEGKLGKTGKEAIGKATDATGGLTGDIGAQAGEKTHEAAAKFQGRFGAAREQLDSVVDNIADKAAEFAGQASSAAHDAAQTMRREAGYAGGKAYDAAARGSQYAVHAVKEQPLLSLIGIAAIGYAIGFLIHSPMSPLAPDPKKRRYFS